MLVWHWGSILLWIMSSIKLQKEPNILYPNPSICGLVAVFYYGSFVWIFVEASILLKFWLHLIVFIKLCMLLNIIFVFFNQMMLLISNYFVLFKPEYQDKMKELLAEPSNQLQSDDTSVVLHGHWMMCLPKWWVRSTKAVFVG